MGEREGEGESEISNTHIIVVVYPSFLLLINCPSSVSCVTRVTYTADTI